MLEKLGQKARFLVNNILDFILCSGKQMVNYTDELEFSAQVVLLLSFLSFLELDSFIEKMKTF